MRVCLDLLLGWVRKKEKTLVVWCGVVGRTLQEKRSCVACDGGPLLAMKLLPFVG